MKIADHWLVGEEVCRIRCTKCNRQLEMVDTIVRHSTDVANAMSSVQYLARPDPSVSARLVIVRSGQVISLSLSAFDGSGGVTDYTCLHWEPPES